MKSSELKKEALSSFSGKFSKLVLIQFMYVIISLAFSLVISLFSGKSNSFEIISFILYFLYFIITFPFSFGVLSSIIDISKGEDVSVTEFINIGLKKFSSYWKVMLRILLKIIVPIFLFVIIASFLAGTIITRNSYTLTELTGTVAILFLIIYLLLFVFIIYLILPYVLSLFILYDNPDMNSKEILEESSTMMKDNKMRYVKLLLSFIGWFLLSGIVMFLSKNLLPNVLSRVVNYIPALFLTPYLTITQLSFYNHIKNNTVSNVEVVEKSDIDENDNKE